MFARVSLPRLPPKNCYFIPPPGPTFQLRSFFFFMEIDHGGCNTYRLDIFYLMPGVAFESRGGKIRNDILFANVFLRIRRLFYALA